MVSKISTTFLTTTGNHDIRGNGRNTYTMLYGPSFAIAMYEENPVAVVLVIAGVVLLILLIIIKVYLRKKEPIDTFGKWLRDTSKYSVKRFKELRDNRKNK